MASNARNQLLPGEKLVLQERQNIIVLFLPAFFDLTLFIIFFAVPFYFQKIWLILLLLVPSIHFMQVFLQWRQKKYLLTTHRVIKQKGVLSISTFDTPLDKINNVFHWQTFLGRILKFGNVGLETANTKGTTILDRISNPLQFKNAIVQQGELYHAQAVRKN